MNELCIGFPRRAPERCPLRMGRARAGVLRISEAALMRASSPVTRGQFAARGVGSLAGAFGVSVVGHALPGAAARDLSAAQCTPVCQPAWL